MAAGTRTGRAGMTDAGTVTAMLGEKCVPLFLAQFPPVITPPSDLATAAPPVQVSQHCNMLTLPSPLILQDGFYMLKYLLCLSEESSSHKPELSEASVCLAPGGEYFVEGETWNIDSCTQCTCHSGRVLCETEVCPPLLCHSPIRTQDSCCPHCPGALSMKAFV